MDTEAKGTRTPACYLKRKNQEREMTNEDRAVKIRFLMVERKMSIVKLAAAAGVSKNTICNIRDGKNVTMTTLTKIADALNISPTMLV